MLLHMDVENELVYRIISQPKSIDFESNDTIPIPMEREDFPCTPQKKATEDCFEKLRASSFTDLPSRKSSLFVLPYDLKIVDKWLSDHYPHNDYDYTLYKLRISGTLIWCDEDKFTSACIEPDTRETDAMSYWNSAGDRYDSFELPEGLFHGEATLVAKEDKHFCAPFPPKSLDISPLPIKPC